MSKARKWARGGRGQPRICMTCGLMAENKAPIHCTEERHHAYSESRHKDKNNRSRMKRENRRRLGIREADLRGGVSRHGRVKEPDMPGEMWLPVYEQYSVSSLGRVRSVYGWLMRQQATDGYKRVTLALKTGKKTVTVHSLVCGAFHGDRPPGMQAAHNDGNPENNRACNLRWATPVENASDKRRHGTMPIGEKAGTAKLTEETVRNMLGDHSSGLRVVQIAKKYGIDSGRASLIVRGLSWKHVFNEFQSPSHK